MEKDKDTGIPNFIINTVNDLVKLQSHISSEINLIQNDIQTFTNTSIDSITIATKLKGVIDSIKSIDVEKFLAEYNTLRDRHESSKNGCDTNDGISTLPDVDENQSISERMGEINSNETKINNSKLNADEIETNEESKLHNNINADNEIEPIKEKVLSPEKRNKKLKHKEKMKKSVKFITTTDDRKESSKSKNDCIQSEEEHDTNIMNNTENDILDTKSVAPKVDKNSLDAIMDSTEETCDEEIEEKKFGIIKCVDITKLLAPTSADPIDKTSKLLNVATKNDSIILLSSESETDTIRKPIRTYESRRKQDLQKTIKNKGNAHLNKEKTNSNSSDDDDDDKSLETRKKKKRQTSRTLSKLELYTTLQKARERKLKRKQIAGTISSDDDSVFKKKFNINECFVSLPKIPVENLKDFYLYDKANSINESMKSVKRSRIENSDSDEELIRFKNKQETDSTDNPSKTPRKIKRIGRLLDSDASSNDENEMQNDNSKNESDSETKEKEKNSSPELSNENERNNSSSSESENAADSKKPPRRRIKRMKDSDESSEEENARKKKEKEKYDEDQVTRKKIRNVMDKHSLADATKAAAKEEEERKKRIVERQKLYNDIYIKNFDENATLDKVILDFNEDTKEELLSVHPDLVKKLKPHQGTGVQFMWTACFESLERAKSTEGSGCILAHCMGLGKTLQVITLIHTLLVNSEVTNVRTALVVCPLSTVLNWVSEFKKWLDDIDGEQVNVFDLVQFKQNYERLYQLKDWMKFGGVMVMGYDMFRNLSNPKGKRISKKMAAQFSKVLLEPGPDLVICDEGHLLKNEKTGISIAMNQLKTKRRIVLTGTPLQNNLKEYFCMVQFVKPNLLGTYKEYLNRFVNPITNGQYTDSTHHDILIMRKRAHVLNKMLDAIVERRDYNVLAPFLPPKHEYVLFLTLTPVQISLYEEYLKKLARNASDKGSSYLFTDFQELQRICIHPRVLLDKSNQDRFKKDMEDDDSEGSLKDFIDDDDEEEISEKSSTSNDSNSETDNDSHAKKVTNVRKTRSTNPITIDEENKLEESAHSHEWWSKFCQNDELENTIYSPKIKLLFEILHKCELIGDKLLVFSQSLYSLNLIEYFLARIDDATQNGDAEALKLVGGNPGSWALGLDYFRLDGSTSCENRAQWCSVFNNESNTRARLFLISTRAGGLGINLVAANRVIIFDVSWNPSYDVQSIYRVYRFGQTKPCYIYRFVTQGTMENKIYERQVTKQAISKRVIDAQQIDRHYNQHDLAELYAFNPITDEPQPIPVLPKDRLFADLLQCHSKEIFKYHEHNSLLENKEDEGLNEEERRAAWEEFENEKKAPKFNLMQAMARSGMYETLRTLVQQDNSTWTTAQVNNALPIVVQKISEEVANGNYTTYRRLEEKHRVRISGQKRIQMIYQQYMQQLRNASAENPLGNYDINPFAMAQLGAFAVPGTSSSAALSSMMFPQTNQSSTNSPVPHPTINEVIDLND